MRRVQRQISDATEDSPRESESDEDSEASGATPITSRYKYNSEREGELYAKKTWNRLCEYLNHLNSCGYIECKSCPHTSHSTRENLTSEKCCSQIRNLTLAPADNMTRPRRAASGTHGTSSATISRSTSGHPDDRRQSIKLTVKVPPSKLREVMRANEVDSLQDVLGGGKVLDGPRSRQATTAIRTSTRQPDKPRYTEYDEDDLELEDDEDEDDEEEDEEEDDEEEEEEEGVNDFEEIGAEAEGSSDENVQGDEDVQMKDVPSQPPPKNIMPPKPPKITLKAPSQTNGKQSLKPRLTVTPAKAGPVASVEDQEMEDEPDIDEVEDSSDLSDGNANNLNEEDAEGEDDEVEEDDDAEEEDELAADESGSDDETPGSGMATPDPMKMTKRQRGQQQKDDGLMALDMAPQQRKFFTDEEKAMKKDEHARKRKELTKRKTQEEKAAALNRLLKPQASKARGAAPKPETLAAAAAASQLQEEDEIVERANPLFTRWVSNKDGVRLGVPDEWLGKRVGAVFGPPLPASNGALIQELD